jgi:hypothetical protein
MISQEEFRERVKWVVDEITGCWNVVSHKHEKSTGYISITVKRLVTRVHRLAYLVYKGVLEKGDYVCHHCDNPKCVNPEHLFKSTPKGNMQDMIKKGRFNFGDRREGNFKLTIEQINKVKQSSLSSYKLSEIYNVSSVQIRRIKNGTRCAGI